MRTYVYRDLFLSQKAYDVDTTWWGDFDMYIQRVSGTSKHTSRQVICDYAQVYQSYFSLNLNSLVAEWCLFHTHTLLLFILMYFISPHHNL